MFNSLPERPRGTLGAALNDNLLDGAIVGVEQVELMVAAICVGRPGDKFVKRVISVVSSKVDRPTNVRVGCTVGLSEADS